jgi:hypothetical protein
MLCWFDVRRWWDVQQVGVPQQKAVFIAYDICFRKHSKEAFHATLDTDSERPE